MNVFFLPALGKWGIARFFSPSILRETMFFVVFVVSFLHQSGNWVSVGGGKLAWGGG